VAALEIRLIALAVLLAGLAGGFGLFVRYERSIGSVRTEAKYAARDKAAAQAALAEVQRQAEASAEAANEAQRLTNRARVAETAAAAAGQRLRDRAAILASACAAASTPAGSTAASEAARVLTDLSGRLAEIAGLYASEAERSRIEGSACEAITR
jgi:hypothetical protein